jgi:hypothetical protein
MPLCASTANAVASAYKTAGIKTVQLSGSAESLASIKAYLTCPKLRLWAQIGHGAQGGAIQLGSMEAMGYTPDVTNIKTSIKGKYYIFNCCYVGGSNIFSTTMMNCGATFLSAGDNAEVWSGTSEPAWQKMCQAVGPDKKEVIESFNSCLKVDLKDPWGYRAAGNGPFYVFPLTGVTTENNKKNNLFTMSVNSRTITINLYVNTSVPAKIEIYTLSGKLVYASRVNSPKVSIDPDNLSGKKLSSGSYFLTCNVNGNLFRKSFVMAR